MKKVLSFLTVILALSLCLGGCAVGGNSNMNSDKNSVVYDDTQNTTESTPSVTEEQNNSVPVATELKTATYTVNGVDFKMILVEAGTFTMGSDNTNVAFSESPAHKVTLTQDYLMGEQKLRKPYGTLLWGMAAVAILIPKQA